MKKLSNTQGELKKSVAYKKSVYVKILVEHESRQTQGSSKFHE